MFWPVNTRLPGERSASKLIVFMFPDKIQSHANLLSRPPLARLWRESLDKAITVTFTSVRQLDKTRTGIDFLFEYTYVDSKFVQEPEEVSKTLKGEILTGISDTLVVIWGLNNINDLIKVLFEHAKRHIIKKLEENALSYREEILLLSHNSPQKCPFDPARIKYSLGVPIKLSIHPTITLPREENKNLPVFPDIPPSSIKESKHYEFENGDFKSEADIDHLIQLMFDESESLFYYFTEKGKGITDDLLKKAKENGSIIMNETDLFYYRHPKNKRDFVKIEVRDGNFDREWEKDLVENSPMFMRIKLNLSNRKRTELQTLLKISMEDAIRNKTKIDYNKDKNLKNDHKLKTAPENIGQAFFHFFGPLDSSWKNGIFLIIMLLVICFLVFGILPEKTKLDFIDWLKGNKTVSSQGPLDNANASKRTVENTVILSGPPREPIKKVYIPNKTIKHVGADLFQTEVFIKADDQGRIYIKNGKEITHLTQFCPEEWANGCLDDINIKRNGNVFELDRARLLSHQTAFNFRNAEGGWLSIPDRQRVTFGENIEIIIRAKGSHFIYIGQIQK